METNNETNLERLPQKQFAQGKSGSEPDHKGQKADGTNEPENDKKPRKAKSERLKELLEDQAKLTEIIETLKSSIADANSKDALRLMEKLGEACFKALSSQQPVELCGDLEGLLLKNMSAKDQAWYGQYGKSLLAQGLPKRRGKYGDSGNNAGVKENKGNVTTGDPPAKF